MINLKERRIELGLTLEEVGKACGVGKSTVRKWETGMIENMRRDKVVALAKILLVSPIDIVNVYEPDTFEFKLPTEQAALIYIYNSAPEVIKDAVWRVLGAERPNKGGDNDGK